VFGVCVLLTCAKKQYYDVPGSDEVTIKWQRLELIDVEIYPDTTVCTFRVHVEVTQEPFGYIKEEFSKANEDASGKDSNSLQDDPLSGSPIKNVDDPQNFYTYRTSDQGGTLKELLDSCHAEADIEVDSSPKGDLALYYLFIHRLRDYDNTTIKYAGAYIADPDRQTDTAWHGETKGATAIYTLIDAYGSDWWQKVVNSTTAHEIGHCFMMGHCVENWAPLYACMIYDSTPPLDSIEELFSDTFCTLHVDFLRSRRP
jgi:hypothetical protein